MGILLSRVRKKKSAIETLEKLENDIKEIEESRTNAQKKFKRITKLLLVYSVGLCILCGIIFYFQFTSALRGTLLYLVPLAISPLLLYIIRRIIAWYYVRLINENQKRLIEMKKEKKRILDEVMDKETYKVAKQILEKFSEDTAPKPNYNMPLATLSQANNGLKRRAITAGPKMPIAQPPPVKSIIGSQVPQPFVPSSSSGRPALGPPTPMLRFPAPILPLQRSYMDRVVEYLIGDGPNNRYALICSQCHSHNGMALKEEFEYIGFKCCYCFHYNPARKIKPEAPKLETSFQSKRESESDSEKTSDENSDADLKPLPVETSPDLVENSEFSNKDDSNTIETSTKVLNLDGNAPDLQPNVTEGDSEAKEANDIDREKEVSNSAEEQSDQPGITESNTDCDESLVKS